MCDICNSHKRDHTLVCVVEDIRDVMAIENTNQFKGVYHVLGGKISPIDGVNIIHKYILGPLEHPEDLMSWCYLWEELAPDGFEALTGSELENAIINLSYKIVNGSI